jgi:hypothetical protein
LLSFLELTDPKARQRGFYTSIKHMDIAVHLRPKHARQREWRADLFAMQVRCLRIVSVYLPCV